MVALTLIKIDAIHFDCNNGIFIHLHEIIFVYVQLMLRDIRYPCYIYLLLLFIYHIVHLLLVMQHGFYRRA